MRVGVGVFSGTANNRGAGKMKELTKSDFIRSEWRDVVALAALRIAVGLDGEHATRWSMENVYQSRWSEPTFEKTSLTEVEEYFAG